MAATLLQIETNFEVAKRRILELNDAGDAPKGSKSSYLGSQYLAGSMSQEETANILFGSLGVPKNDHMSPEV